MFSFKTLATAAAVAFGALSVFAAPVAETALVSRQVEVGAAAQVGVAAIISSTTSALGPAIAELHLITQVNATVDVLTPIVADISATLNAAIGEVNALRGQPTAVILAGIDVDALISVAGLASLVADLINTVFIALGAVLNVAASVNISVVIPLLVSVGALVGTLVTAVVTVGGSAVLGLVPAVLVLVHDVLAIIAHLNITALIGLGLHL
ncbi:hypothetical protein PHLGIDRAFT_36293 [Phlebiopsis gigantea 11061_1 CR5-6]|uniref:Uncharacterized protein n=1 Tax=Phlebiopsis gigantea (strain 11061_1 CR5-6) TaxID=745531 RepID=A0A0C3S5Q7_PHLG1|nr:hypothetical protein PHLGIDRAFT_36293 [Phlebiopsis gigantea 11061_1 CR5-6]